MLPTFNLNKHIVSHVEASLYSPYVRNAHEYDAVLSNDLIEGDTKSSILLGMSEDELGNKWPM